MEFCLKWDVGTISLNCWVRWQQQVLWLAPKKRKDLEQEQQPVSDQVQ